MASRYKDKETGAVVLSLNGRWISWAHTLAAYSAFLSALIVGITLHYHKIVENEWYGYPQEWFPSVSATIGDRYPERSFFMFFIALTSGPRFALVGLWYVLTADKGRRLPKAVAMAGIVRTLTCGGWTYVTSTDAHDWHDIFMISYLVFTIPWTAGCLALSPPNAKAIQYRKVLAGAFFGTLVPLVYFFIQHKVHRVPGAYTTYAFFEWSLVLLDVAFDAVTALDFDKFELVIRDVTGSAKGVMHSVPVTTNEKERTLSASPGAWSVLAALDTVADVYHGFVFWSMLTGLGVSIWYFPLWYMGISGYEAFVMAPVGPFLLALPAIRTWVHKNQRTAHLGSLVGLLAYLFQEPVRRLLAIGFGVFMSCLAWAATLSSGPRHGPQLETRVVSWIVGLLMSSVVKFIWQTNNPLWPVMHAENGGWNGVGLAVAVVAAYRFSRQSPLPIVRGKTGGFSLLSALGIGGLFFGLHSLLSDTSTMILWVWDGYPVRGPVSNVHAWLTVASMTGGVVLGISKPELTCFWSTYAAGCVGAALLTLYSHWLGYLGGLVLAGYLMAVAAPLMANAAGKNVAVTFGFGFFVYNFMVLFHVWVVAYAFVPGGPLVRERTDWVMTAMMVLVGAGVLDVKLSQPRVKKSDGRRRIETGHRKYLKGILGLLNVVFLWANFARFPSNDYTPYHGDDGIITAGIWTIHFSLDNDMWSSEYRIRDLVKELELDVVGFLESDCQRIIMGNRDFTQFLAEDLGMYVDYGPGPNKHTWGAALLSKFPILNSTHHLLPSPVGELAPAIHATIDAYGTLVDVFVFHSGQEEDAEDRRLQSEYLSRLMGNSTRPSMLLSYLVTKPLEGNYNTYVSDVSGMHDVDATDWDRWCQYILYKGLERTGYARVSRGTITDTELQVAKFVVPRTEKHRALARDATPEARDKRVVESEVPAGRRFPALFRGEGVRGHRYHVFDEPRYYQLCENGQC